MRAHLRRALSSSRRRREGRGGHGPWASPCGRPSAWIGWPGLSISNSRVLRAPGRTGTAHVVALRAVGVEQLAEETPPQRCPSRGRNDVAVAGHGALRGPLLLIFTCPLVAAASGRVQTRAHHALTFAAIGLYSGCFGRRGRHLEASIWWTGVRCPRLVLARPAPGGSGSPSAPTMWGRPSLGWWGPEEGGAKAKPIQRWKVHPSGSESTVPETEKPRWSAGRRHALR